MLYTFDPAEVIIIAGAVPLSGFADGTFVSAQFPELYSDHKGADGKLSRARTNDRSGSLTVTLAMTSPGNDVLSGYTLSDRASNSGSFPVTVKWGRTIVFSPSAYVKQLPTIEFSKDITERAWLITMSECDVTVGGIDGSSST